jgi:hypothetical protein
MIEIIKAVAGDSSKFLTDTANKILDAFQYPKG